MIGPDCKKAVARLHAVPDFNVAIGAVPVGDPRNIFRRPDFFVGPCHQYLCAGEAQEAGEISCDLEVGVGTRQTERALTCNGRPTALRVEKKPDAVQDSTEPRSYLSLLQIPKANQQPAFGGSL